MIRERIRSLAAIAMLTMATASCHAADASPASPAPAPASDTSPADVDNLLTMLQQSGETLKTLITDVSMGEKDTTALNTIRTGKAWLELKADGTTRFRVSFDKWSDGEKEVARKLDYVLDGAWLTERDHEKKIEVRRQVLKPGQKMNLIQLGEGPFPLPIGQKPEEVKKQFKVTLIKPRKKDPPGTQHLQLEPIPGTPMADKYKVVDVYVDPQTKLPARVSTMAKNDSVTTTDLKQPQVNPKLGDADFKLDPIKSGDWNIKEVPMAN